MKRLKATIFLVLCLLILSVGFSSAETKQIICKIMLTQKFMDEFDDAYQGTCERLKGSIYGKSSCDSAKRQRAQMKECKDSGFSYAYKKTLIFEKSSLDSTSGGSAEVSGETCWMGREPTYLFHIKTTPSFIKFYHERYQSFTIDRETLKGWTDKRGGYDCTVSDYVNKKNKI